MGRSLQGVVGRLARDLGREGAMERKEQKKLAKKLRDIFSDIEATECPLLTCCQMMIRSRLEVA